MVDLKSLCQYLDEYLRLGMYRDMSQNGLQVEGAAQVSRVALAVDARLQTFEAAIEQGAQLLLCHHGLFWGRSELVVGHHYKRLKTLLEGGLGVYAAHLPLDAHLEVGNNAVLARALGLEELEPWAEYKGQVIGIRGALPETMSLEAFSTRLQEILAPVDGHVQSFGQGKGEVRTVGIVTGDASNELPQAARDGLDVLLTGEPSHVFASLADELGVTLVCGGHYATETFGVKALGEHLVEQFEGLETVFIHAPTYA